MIGFNLANLLSGGNAVIGKTVLTNNVIELSDAEVDQMGADLSKGSAKKVSVFSGKAQKRLDEVVVTVKQSDMTELLEKIRYQKQENLAKVHHSKSGLDVKFVRNSNILNLDGEVIESAYEFQLGTLIDNIEAAPAAPKRSRFRQ